jgi:hypothetical protein
MADHQVFIDKLTAAIPLVHAGVPAGPAPTKARA